MAWADNWTAAGYHLKNADVLALWNALNERADVLRDYAYYPATSLDLIAAAYPLGVDQYHDPANVAHPEYIPAHLQALTLWNGMKQAVREMIGNPGNFSYPAAFDKDNDLDGKAFATADFSGGHGAFVSFFGASYFGGYPGDWDEIGIIRARAGLPLNYGRTIQNDGWRRRCPRYVSAERQGADTPTGRLMQWNAAAGQWRYVGQAGGEMPDMLDSTLAPPNNTPPGRYGRNVYRGDYLDTVSANELKQVLKKLVAWGWFTSWYGGETKTGENINNNSYTLAKSNAQTNYNAAATTAGGGVLQYAEAQYFAGSGTPYSAYLVSQRAKMRAQFNNRKARSFRWFGAATPFNEPGGGAGTENTFDNAGLTYVADHIWKLVFAQVANTNADIPAAPGVAPDMISDWVGQLVTTPAFPGFPFAGNPDRFNGWEIHYGIGVADYSGAFAYT
jgi:hypothetical protein